MSRTKIIEVLKGCENCHRNAHQIWWEDNHGMEEHLETHCNKCGWAIDSDGEIRNPGQSYEGIASLRKK